MVERSRSKQYGDPPIEEFITGAVYWMDEGER
jgi:hypothetical protein